MEVVDLEPFPLQREQDFFLMDVAISSPLFTDTEIRFVNYCRLYLQVLQGSDICSACGTRLAAGVTSGVLLDHLSKSKLN